jgi:SAM-dependent methyltransferase
MEPQEYEAMAAVEDRHFWFVGTRAVVRDAVAASGIPPDGLVLDVGCGTGGTMRALHGLARFVGLDMNATAATLARRRTGNPVTLGSVTDLPFADGTFDGVLALDVYEHVTDDARALAETRRVLRRGGTLVLTVPCHPSLFSEHDRALHHVRRYRRPEILARLREAGLEPARATWLNMSLFPAAAAHRLLSRFLPGRGADRSDTTRGVGPLNGLLTGVMMAERRALHRMDLPFGLGLMVVAR